MTRNDSQLPEEKPLNEANFYRQQFGEKIDAMDRGGVIVPTDNTCQ